MSDFPQFAFHVDEDDETWWLYRQMKTEQYAVASKPAPDLDPGDFYWQEKADADVEDRNDHGLQPVREEFLDAVAATFLRAPAGIGWELEPVYEPLTWYEDETIEDLRSLRNETQEARMVESARQELDSPYDNPREMPSGAWDLVKKARRQFTLSDSRAFKPDESPSAKDSGEPLAEEMDLADFMGGDS